MKNEMAKLIAALVALEIPHEVVEQFDFGTPQVWFPSYDNNTLDVICNDMSMGGKMGLLEMWDTEENEDPIGYLTATQVLERILKKVLTD